MALERRGAPVDQVGVRRTISTLAALAALALAALPVGASAAHAKAKRCATASSGHCKQHAKTRARARLRHRAAHSHRQSAPLTGALDTATADDPADSTTVDDTAGPADDMSADTTDTTDSADWTYTVDDTPIDLGD
jgi:hypothetical protein